MSIRLIDGSEFLHIPKTGGTWVHQVLEEQGLIKDVYVGGHEHANYDRVQSETHAKKKSKKPRKLTRSLSQRINRVLPRRQSAASNRTPTHREPFRFCFVRHPLRWYESWWKYMNARGWNDWGDPKVAGGWHPNAALNGLGSSDFNQFVQNVIDTRPGYVSELFFSYAKPGIAYIGKTEHLTDDLLSVVSHLGLQVDSQAVKNRGPVNASKDAGQRIEWDPVLRQTLMRLELPALVHFGYLEMDDARELGLADTLKPASALQRFASP